VSLADGSARLRGCLDRLLTGQRRSRRPPSTPSPQP
jgi:hypothetical protein